MIIIILVIIIIIIIIIIIVIIIAFAIVVAVVAVVPVVPVAIMICLWAILSSLLIFLYFPSDSWHYITTFLFLALYHYFFIRGIISLLFYS